MQSFDIGMKVSMKILLFILLSGSPLLAQVAKEDSLNEKVFVFVETTPEFVGGNDALMIYLSKNLKYPKEAYEAGIVGKVFIQFVVAADGEISNVHVIRGINDAMDKEAIRVVSEMPKWKAGTRQGKPVRTQFVLPINFQIPKKN
jgi:protein TonB